MLDVTCLDDVARQQHPTGQHRAEAVEEHVQAAQRGPEESGGGHADLGVTRDDGNVGHQRHLETAAERVAADLADGDLREAHQIVIEAERLAVDREPPTLAGSALLGFFVFAAFAVPAVGVVHIRAGAEDSLGSTQQHHGDVVVLGDLIQAPADGLAHRSVVGVALLGIVEGDRRDPLVRIDVEQHAIVS